MTKFCYLYICFVLAFLLPSCRDEVYLRGSGSVGEDVTVTVPLDFSGMEVKTRANLEDYLTNHIESVWIRTYSATSHLATMDEWEKLDKLNLQEIHKPKDVQIATKTGPTYIVAVANVSDDVMGVTKDDLTPKPLADLLDAANTWDKFLSIAIDAPSDYYTVEAPATPLVMAGCYVDDHVELGDWQTRNFTSCQIDVTEDGTFELKGAIHLRRIVSQITFNLLPGENITITPNSYRIVNVPKYSWLYERDNNDGRFANFGDMATAGNAGDYYADTDLYSSTSFEPGGTEGSYTFNFWQAENKHTGTSTMYNDRQKKNEKEGTLLFTALTGETWTPNNMATYVVINCNVDYNENVKVNDKGEIDNGEKEAYRSGNADYIIHLGYMGGVASDFNAFRNTKYTYNVTVLGLDKIRVEAYDEGDTNGVEGLVTDVTNPQYILDCHYHAYNIQLTDQDMVNLGFIITTYDNGIAHTYQDIDFKQTDGSYRALTEQERLYIDWVQLRPATDANTLAEYKPASGENADGKTFNLYDAAKGLTAAQKSSNGYYTVFVNEYTYEDNDGDESKIKDNWKRYVNQPSRRYYIRVTRKISADGKSMYASSKYAGIQRSIQTYYSNRETPPSGGILGIEHENEVFGLNVVRNFTAATNNVNGRYNVWLWLNKDSGTLPQSGTASRAWSEVITPTSMQHVYAVNGQGIEVDEHYASVPALAYPDNVISTKNNYSLPQGYKDDTSYWIEAVNACMNRNRDNNGNGRIDAEELRWYVPAKDKYLRMIIGNVSLVSPIADYNSVPKLTVPKNDDGSESKTAELKNCTRLMSFSSDGHALISFDGPVSSNWFDSEGMDIASTPWDVRCVRNLGTNLKTVDETDKTTPAYVHDAATRTVTMAYYDSKSYRRTESFSGNGSGDGSMPVHVIHQERFSRPFHKFQYSEGRYELDSDPKSRHDGYLSETNIQGVNRPLYSGALSQINNNELCGSLGEGWRVPNIFELAILRTIGIFDGFHSGIYKDPIYLISCTTSYYDASGKGYNLAPTTTRGFLGVTYNNTVQLPMYDGHFERRIYYRCVRDVK